MRLRPDAGLTDPELQPDAMLRGVRCPVLLIHGEKDDMIPVAHARRLYALVSAQEKRLVEVSGRGHDDLPLLETPVLDSLLAFVERRIGS